MHWRTLFVMDIKIKLPLSSPSRNPSLSILSSIKISDLPNLFMYSSDTNTTEKGTKSCIFLFQKKGDLGITNYRGITLTAIVAKLYNTLLLSHIQPKEKS